MRIRYARAVSDWQAYWASKTHHGGPPLASVYLFEHLSLILIDGGYLAVSYAVMGAILGVWP